MHNINSPFWFGLQCGSAAMGFTGGPCECGSEPLVSTTQWTSYKIKSHYKSYPHFIKPYYRYFATDMHYIEGGSLRNVTTCDKDGEGSNIMKIVWRNLWMTPFYLEFVRINYSHEVRNEIYCLREEFPPSVLLYFRGVFIIDSSTSKIKRCIYKMLLLRARRGGKKDTKYLKWDWVKSYYLQNKYILLYF